MNYFISYVKSYIQNNQQFHIYHNDCINVEHPISYEDVEIFEQNMIKDSLQDNIRVKVISFIKLEDEKKLK